MNVTDHGTGARDAGAPRRFARLPRRPIILSKPLAVLLAAAVIGLAAVWLASRLQLRTAFTELLPERDPAVLTLARAERRVGDLNLLSVGIRSPDRAANLAYAQALTDHLRRLPPSQVNLVVYHLRDLQKFFRDNRWLYASPGDLEAIRDRLRGELLRRKNPLVVSLDDDQATAAVSDQALRSRLDHTPLADRFPDGYFVHGDVAWVLVLPAGGLLGEHAGEALVRAVDDFVAVHPPASFHPAMRVQSLGPVIVGLENRRAIENDVIGVTVVCTVLVALSLALYFRQLRAVPLVVAAAALGTAVAFAVGDLAFGYLNASTAFLGSIILGNGINHSIVLLARFLEVVRTDATAARPPTRAATVEALRVAIAGTARGTFTAALAAAGAYLSLTLTNFRGFSQFGVMAAAGSLACWASAYTVIPAWLAWRSGRGRPVAGRAPLSLGPLGSLVSRRASLVVAVSVLLTAATALGLRHFARAPFEYDFRRLRADVARTPERHQLDDNLNDLLGRWHSPTVVLADRLDQVEAIRARIAANDSRERPVIGQVVTIYDILPGTPAVQQRKLALLGEIRRLTEDPAMATLPDRERQDIERLRPGPGLRELHPEDLPALARRPFTEADGTVGRVVLTYHAARNVSMWDGHDLLAIAHVLERLRLPDGSVIETSGAPMIFGAMLRSVLHDGPRATVLSFLAVALIIGLLVHGRRAKGAALATLAIGVLWMIGAAGLLGVRITFLNFIALPITFGVGGEYALNLVARWEKERSVVAAVRSVGGAVLLCSWTTIVGYGSLLVAHSQALRGFGSMAILGELACITAALVAMPALAVWCGGRVRHGRSPSAERLRT
jgi:predicted RND superfamily exporter protein